MENEKIESPEVEKTISEKLDEIQKKSFVDPKFCQHEPEDDGTHKIWPGKTALCKKCGVVLVYGNREPGSRVRMSKKERRRAKNAPVEITKTSAMVPTGSEYKEGVQA